jgi:hypothetical protein
MTLDPLYSVAAIILCGFCLSYSVKNSLPIDRFVRPQLECLINHLQFSRLCSSLFLFVSSIHRQGLALVARSIVQPMVDNQRRSGGAIAGFESCWLDSGSFAWHLHQIDSYPLLTEDRDPPFISVYISKDYKSPSRTQHDTNSEYDTSTTPLLLLVVY